jgi:uncharacterized protein YutE (UPF0331/DUF86 family)
MRKEKLFEKIGEMTVLFATLEHQLQLLLEILVGEATHLIGPFFIHELNLVVLLRKIKYIARFKIQGNASLLDELEHVLKQIEATRDTRNLLVHGYWQIEEGCGDCPVRVSDFKMKFEEGQWQELTDTTFNEKKLTHLVRRLEAMSHDVTYITRKLRSVQAPANGVAQTP